MKEGLFHIVKPHTLRDSLSVKKNLATAGQLHTVYYEISFNPVLWFPVVVI